MIKITEFYPERQGRPAGIETVDLESGQNSLLFSYLSLRGEYTKVEALLDRLLSELVQKMEAQTRELREVKLHLASMSDAQVEDAHLEEDD